MKKTKVGQGRRLLLRGEVVAQLERAELQQIAGGQDNFDSFPYNCTSHPPTLAAGPALK